MAVNTKGIYFSTSADAPITEEARSLAMANSVPVNPNYLINSAFDIWQRGTSGFTSGYFADRWFLNGANSGSRSTDVPNSNFLYSALAVNTSNAWAGLTQRVEAANARELAGEFITVSGWFKRTGSTNGGTLNVNMDFANAVDNFSSTTFVATAVLSATTPSTSWTYYSRTFPIVAPSGVANGVQFSFTHNGSSGNSLGGLWAGLQIEIGSAATHFRRNGANFDQELSSCKRYFWALTPSTLPGQITSLHATGSTTGYAGFIYGHTFRVAPSMTVSANNVLRWHNPGVSIGEANSISAATGVDSMQLNLGTASGLTFGTYYAVEWTSGSGFIFLSAEL